VFISYLVDFLTQCSLENPTITMRLLKIQDDGELSLVEVFGDKIPPYSILSHTWGAASEEVTFKDIIKSTGKGKAGYQKIQFCGERAAADGWQYFWLDTCCT
jgi:hypothetical protein